MNVNQKLNLQMVALNVPKVKYDQIGTRVTTISFDVPNLDLRIEKEIAMQGISGIGLADIGIDFLQATMVLEQADPETGEVVPSIFGTTGNVRSVTITAADAAEIAENVGRLRGEDGDEG